MDNFKEVVENLIGNLEEIEYLNGDISDLKWLKELLLVKRQNILFQYSQFYHQSFLFCFFITIFL